MMFARTILRAAVVALLLSPLAASASNLLLKPYKDDLFGYPDVLSSADNGAYRAVDYREMRDINQRDEVPERRAHSRYVSLGVRRQQQDLSLEGNPHVAVGKTSGASIITVYLHGQGGNRKQGVDDFSFGGNFNRIKNLMADNGGLYLSPDVLDFGAAGTKAVARLIGYYSDRSPGAPVFVACGSMGGALCYRLAEDAGIVPRLGGLLLLGSMWSDGFLKGAAFTARVPLFIGQGSRDKVFPVDHQEAFFRSIRAAAPGYPVRMVRFETGTHGTPIRMTDWRETLNWMLSLR